MTDPSENQPALEVRTTRFIGDAVDSGWWRELPPSALEEILVCINTSRQRKSDGDRLDHLGNAMTKIRNALNQHQQPRAGHEESRIELSSHRRTPNYFSMLFSISHHIDSPFMEV